MPISASASHDAPPPTILAIFAADAALDLDGFMALLTENVRLSIGSQPPLQGHAAVRQAIAGLFGLMRAGIRHRLVTRFGTPDGMLAYQAEADFALQTGRDVTVGYVNVLHTAADGRISDYRIFIDLSPLGP